jgi:hypothetical protein
MSTAHNRSKCTCFCRVLWARQMATSVHLANCSHNRIEQLHAIHQIAIRRTYCWAPSLPPHVSIAVDFPPSAADALCDTFPPGEPILTEVAHPVGPSYARHHPSRGQVQNISNASVLTRCATPKLIANRREVGSLPQLRSRPACRRLA